MRVIDEVERIKVCDTCNSKIGFYAYEILHGVNPPFCEEVYYYYIHCPKCKNKMYIRKEEV